MLRISGWIPSILLIALTVTGCGGGGGGSASSPAPVITYTGLTTPAVITEANAEDLAFGSLLGIESGAVFTLSAGLRDKPGKTISSRPNAIDLPLSLRKAALKVSAANSKSTASRTLAFTETDTIIGSCGGTADYILDIGDATGTFEGTFVFSRYCEDGIVISGDTEVDGTVDLATGEIVTIAYAFESLTVDGFIYKGTISVDASAAPQIITLDLLARENASGKVDWVRNYTLSVTEISAAEIQIEATGAYYDPDLGYIDVSTPEPLLILAGDWPGSGVLLCLGGRNTKARLTAVDASSYRLEADANGDDFYDYDSGVLPWPEKINPASWQQKASMPTPQPYSAVASLGGKIYVMGGTLPHMLDEPVQLVEMYDPAANRWIARSPMPTARYSLAAAGLNGKIYAIGGSQYPGSQLNGPRIQALNAVEEYDPARDTWATRSNMPNRRMGHKAAALNGKIYVIGGVLNNVEGQMITTGLVEAYEPLTDSWETKAAMPTPRTGPEIVVVNDRIYAIGGWYASNPYKFYNSIIDAVEEYDPSTDSWNTKAPIPNRRLWPASGVVDGEIYVVGGIYYDPYNLNQKFNPLANAWFPKTPMPVSGECTAGIGVNNKIYVIGTADPQTMYEYDPGLDP